MEDELQSEAPAEREKLFTEWSKFDSAFIRELVENHRMARELAETSLMFRLDQTLVLKPQ